MLTGRRRQLIEHSIRLGDTDVQCIESDNSDERIFILLHGAHFNSTIWAKVNTLRLLEAYSVCFLAPDMPGFGRTPKSRVYSEGQGLNRLILDICSHKSAKRAVLMGASMGGGIALSFAREHPSIIDGLFLIGTVGLDAPGVIDFLSLINTPVELVWGSEDSVVPVSRAREVVKKLPRAELVVIDGAAHPAYLSSPEVFNSHLERWILANGFARRHPVSP